MTKPKTVRCPECNNVMSFKDKLIKMKACREAVEWVGNKTMREAWDTCYRGDWMLWLYATMRPKNIRELTLAKGHCANIVRRLMKDERSIKAVDVAIAFGEGRASREELDAATVHTAYATASAAAYAAAYASADGAAAEMTMKILNNGLRLMK